MTDELIDRLSADLKPVSPIAMQRIMLAALVVSGALAIGAMNMWLGMRPDMDTAMSTMSFWAKFGYTLALAIIGATATFVLARPDGRTRKPWLAALALAAILIAVAFVQLVRTEPGAMMPLVVGGTALVCPWRIVVLALPILLGIMLALRRMAPTRPVLAGFAAGITAGSTGAWIYSFACAEPGMMFLALWYSLGILTVGALGALLGKFALRW